MEQLVNDYTETNNMKLHILQTLRQKLITTTSTRDLWNQLFLRDWMERIPIQFNGLFLQALLNFDSASSVTFSNRGMFFFYHVSSFLMLSGNILWQIYYNAGKTTTMFPGESTPSFLLPPSSSSPKSVIPCLSWMTYDVNSTRWISCRGALDFASGNKTTQQVYTRRSLLLCFWLLSGVSWLVSLCHWLISGLRSRK